MIREMSQNFVCAQRVIKNTKLSRFEMNSIMHEGKSDFMSGQLAFSGLMQNTMVPAIYNFIWDRVYLLYFNKNLVSTYSVNVAMGADGEAHTARCDYYDKITD